MALHPSFPDTPCQVLDPAVRWFPASEDLREPGYDKLLPPLVAKVRQEVQAWRDADYEGASDTSRALLQWWFDTHHLIAQADATQTRFRYYFAQREAVESVIWLHDVHQARDKHDLLRFDASGTVSGNMFNEDWPRFVVKMATGAGKTKVLALLMAWCYFHKLYEPGSTGVSRIEGNIRLRDTRAFRTRPRAFLPARKSVFNRIVGEGVADGLELAFAAFLEQAEDVQAYGKNYIAVGFKIDHVKTNGELSTYTPDFIVRTTDGAVWIVETKGREELDLPQKMQRLGQWCQDATEASMGTGGTRYGFVYVDQASFKQDKPGSFAGLVSAFREYQP